MKKWQTCDIEYKFSCGNAFAKNIEICLPVGYKAHLYQHHPMLGAKLGINYVPQFVKNNIDT